MPLFFFFSGFFFVVGKYSFKDFALRRLRTLYLPFVVWSLVFLALHNRLVAGGIIDGDAYDLHTYKQLVYQIFVKMRQYEPLGGTFWFFPQLLAVNIIGYAYLYMWENIIQELRRWHKGVMIAMPLLIATLMSFFCVAFYAKQFSYITLLGLFFFVCGYCLHRVRLIGKRQLLAALIVVALSGWTNREMIDLGCAEIIPYALVAIAGIILIYNISSFLTRTQYIGEAFDYLGRHSLSIMILHFAAFKIVSGILVTVGGVPFERLSSHPVIGEASWPWLVCYMVVGITVPLALNKIYSRAKERLRR